MADMFDYLDWYGELSFSVIPFGKIDALILSQLSYINFSGLIPDSFNNPVSASRLLSDFENSKDYKKRLYMGVAINARTPELFEKVCKSKRFKDLKVCGYKEISDEKKIEQLAAMTFMLKNAAVVTFRGTDDTINGWREDFNIACKEEIPSQRDALIYFNQAAGFLNKKIYIAGHSKGGNLAINTATKCGKKLQKKICGIYNFDGPGFSSDFFNKEEFKNIENKLTNIYPSGSLVGMIFNHPQNFEIIKSLKKGVDQHDAMNWQILGSNFIEESEFQAESVFFHNSLNNWIEQLSVEEKTDFVNSIFTVIEATGCKTNTQVMASPVVAAAKMMKCLRGMENDTRIKIRRAIKALRDTVRAEVPFLFQLRLGSKD